jgi:methionine synthase II (cobalamin-independent)
VNPRIKTTVVGSYPVPSWLVGNTSRLVLRDAVMSVLKTQELAGLDLISDGELMRADAAGSILDPWNAFAATATPCSRPTLKPTGARHVEER